MAVIAWECSSQQKLFLGPGMAELTAVNVHPESGPGPVAWDLKNASSFPFHSLLGLAQFLNDGEVNNTDMLENQVVSFIPCLLNLITEGGGGGRGRDS